MNVESIKTSLQRGVSRSTMMLRKHSPEILLGAGVIGMVTTVVLASKATLKVNEIVVEHQDTMDKIQAASNSSDQYTDEDALKDKVTLHIQTGLKLTKLYGPALTVGALSLWAILASHGVMAKRQASLVAAYGLLNEGWQAYRARVVEEVGEEKEHEIRLGLRGETTTVKEENESGETVKVKKTEFNRDPDFKSVYSRFFDNSSTQYRSDRLLNKAFLQAQQNYMNDLLMIRGYVFLNEVYEALGLPWSKEGQLVGWVLKGSAEQMKAEGRDGHIDFDMYNPYNDPGREFVNLTNDAILLDFNVDGIIFDLI